MEKYIHFQVWIFETHFFSCLSVTGSWGVPAPLSILPFKGGEMSVLTTPPSHWASGQVPLQTWTTHWKWTFIESGNLNA